MLDVFKFVLVKFSSVSFVLVSLVLNFTNKQKKPQKNILKYRVAMFCLISTHSQSYLPSYL